MAAPGWSSLANCPPPPEDGAAICEINTVIKADDGAIAAAAAVIGKLPDIRATLTADPGRPAATSASSSAKTAFLSPVCDDDRPWRRFLGVLREDGWMGAIQDIIAAGGKEGEKGESFIKMAVKSILPATNAIYGAILPRNQLSAEELSEKFNPTRSWSQSIIRCLAWHPNTCKIAVAMRDDSIQVHSVPPGPAPAPLLKYKQQRAITCMSWRPFYASELAVGCSTGILIWTVDPGSVVARPSAGCVSVLQSPGHAPVTCIEWQPNGELLLSCSASDSSVILWNTASETRTALKRVGPGYYLSAWSPSGKNVFVASTGAMFRVWSASRFWSQTKWDVFSGHVTATCWSADDTCCFYATSEDPRIFCIRFQRGLMLSDEEDFESVGSAIPVMDLEMISLDEHEVGGIVQCMKWDRFGDRLAVSFRESNLIALFQTQVSPANVSLFPLGLINGESVDEFPSCFEFARHFNQGALLTIAWSSGRVQHFPMFFTPSSQAAKMTKDTSFVQDFQHTGGMSRQLSTSHLLNNSLHAQADFEPLLFSSPTT